MKQPTTAKGHIRTAKIHLNHCKKAKSVQGKLWRLMWVAMHLDRANRLLGHASSIESAK